MKPLSHCRSLSATLALAAILAALMAAMAPAWALDGSIPLTEYHHDIWTAREGAPGAVSSMAQTSDGWLWIGSAAGLYRFDGIRFQRFDAPAGEGPVKRMVTSLTALRNGDLLIGYFSGGMSLLRNGHVSHYPTMVGDAPVAAVSGAIVDEDGMLWAATTNGLLQLRDKAWRQVNAAMGLPPGRLTNLLLDQYGQLWTASADSLFVLDRHATRFRRVLTGAATVNLTASPDGRLWLDTHAKLIPVPPQHQGAVQPRPPWLAQSEGQENGLFDRDGNFWSLACPVGICRASGTGQQPSQVLTPNAEPRSRLDQAWQVSSLTGNVLFEDQDGNLWVGTQNGVERFRHKRLRPVTFVAGERFFSMAQDAQGDLWAYSRPAGGLWRLLPGGAARLEEKLPESSFGVLSSAPDGSLLVAKPDAIERRRGAGKVERIAYPSQADGKPLPGNVTRLIDDGAALWLSIAASGTYRLQAGAWVPAKDLGLPAGNFFLARGRTGAAWLGFRDGMLVHFDQGRITRYGREQGLDLGPITFVQQGVDVVVAGEEGMAVLTGKRFQRLQGADADALSSVSGMVVDPNGDRWFNGNLGVLRVKAADWTAALAAPDAELKYSLFGVLDGYLGAAETNNRQPSAVAGADGTLWFVGTGGVTWLDRSKVDRQQAPPRVKIDSLVARGQRHVEFPSRLALKPGVTAFRIEYTALSYTAPELLRFRYRLDGVDEEWQEAGNRRAVSYSNLGPGDYRFRVAAVDADGQWNQDDATIALRILPTFTQTPLFYALCLAALAGLGYALYRLRIKQLTLRLKERLAERERIARALHDTFLQSVQSLILNFHAATLGLPPDSETRRKMERVLDTADRVMADGRDQVQALRTAAMRDGDLAQALRAIADTLQESHRCQFSLRVAGQERALESDVSDEIYHIAREALINAFRHAGAAAISVDIDYGRRRFVLEVADNGGGIARALLGRGQRAGHWGLPGMRERARRIHATLSFDSAPSKGTTVQLSLAARRAYTG